MRPIEVAIAASVGFVAGAGFAYAPSGATRWNDQYRATLLQIPRGTVELASFGTVELAADDATPIRALHVRVVISNAADDRAWTIDASTTTLELGDRTIAATIMNSDVETLPLAIVARGERAVIDEYFALPAGSPSEPPRFEVTWSVHTASSAIAQRTRFSVDDTPAPRTGIALPAGWGPRWWFDRSYPWPRFYHRSGVIAPRPPSQIAVTRAPIRHAKR